MKSNLLQDLEKFLVEAKKSLAPQDPPDSSQIPKGVRLKSGYTMYHCISAKEIWNLVEGNKYVTWSFSGTDEKAQKEFDFHTNGTGSFYILIQDDYYLWTTGMWDSSEKSTYKYSMLAVPYVKDDQPLGLVFSRIQNDDTRYDYSMDKLTKKMGIHMSLLKGGRDDVQNEGEFKVMGGTTVLGFVDPQHKLLDIETLVIPEGIERIGRQAFICRRCDKVVFPSTLKYISDGAFSDCGYLKLLTFPNGLKSIGQYAFDACIELTSVVMPDTVTEIHKSAFRGCYQLYNVELSKGLKFIGMDSFRRCRSLSSLTIHEGIEEIEADAFTNTGLRTLVIPSSLKKLEKIYYKDRPDENKLTSISVSRKTKIKDINFFRNQGIEIIVRD